MAEKRRKIPLLAILSFLNGFLAITPAFLNILQNGFFIKQWRAWSRIPRNFGYSYFFEFRLTELRITACLALISIQ